MHSLSILRKGSKVLTNVRCFHASFIASQRLQKLEERVAVAVGCTDGIGLQMAKRLAEEGAHVVLSSRRQENIDRAVGELKSQGLKASGFPCHVGDPQHRKLLIDYAAENYGGIDILLNNAGVNAHKGSILDTPDSAFDKIFDVNVKANFCLIRDAVPHMKERKVQGSIILTSSISGFEPNKLPSAYSVSKAAIFSLVKAFMPELLERNIRINCITLGIFKTTFAGVLTNDKVENKYLGYIPMKRFGEPKECAGLASFLSSDDASYITGENFVIAGGAHSRL